MSGKAIFITGATGHIGRRVTEFAIADGYNVRGLVRSDAGEEKLRKLGGTPVRGTILDHETLTHESATADVVIHTVDTLTNDFTQPYEKVIEAEKGALDAIVAGLKGSGKPLITSSGSLIMAPPSDGSDMDESTAYRENAHIRRDISEQYALAQAQNGIRVSAIRLAPLVYGHAASGTKMFIDVGAKAGAAMYVDGAVGSLHAVHVDDAARLYLLAAENAQAKGPILAVNDKHVDRKKLAEAFGKALNVPVKSVTAQEAMAASSTLGFFLTIDSGRASNKKARGLGWQPKEVDIIEDVERGSYAEYAKSLQK